MMRRRIFLWMGLGVLFASLLLCGQALAKQTYSVQPGDTIYSIAGKTGVSVKAIKQANQLNKDTLRVNQTLTIPSSKPAKTARKVSASPSRTEFYAVKKGDTLAGIAKKTGIPAAELRELNGLSGSALKTGQKLVLRPSPDPGRKAQPAEYAKLMAIPDGEEEEEEEELLSPEEAMAALERRRNEEAKLLGRWNYPDEPKLLVRVAMGFLGAPYRLGGSSVTGIDCSAFVRNIYKFFNIDLPRTAFEQSHVGLRVAREDLSEGDLLFFSTRRTVGHVGIYIGNNQFVHAASRKRGVRVDNLDTPYYDRRFIRAVRLKGNGDGL
jgi:cell wall-associated NlpC family hydrolase